MIHATTFGPCRVRSQQIGISLLLSLFFGLFWMGQAEAGASFTVTGGFYSGFDLAVGVFETDETVITLIIGDGQEITSLSAPDLDPLFEFSPSVDLSFGLDIGIDRLRVVGMDHITHIAVFDNLAFDAFSDDMLVLPDDDGVPVHPYQLYDSSPVAVDSNDLLVLLMEDGTSLVLGDLISHPDATLTFTYRKVGEETGEIPEPTMLLLIGVGVMGTIGIIRRKRKHHDSQGGNRMKHVKILLLALGLMPLLIGIASAAELQVLVIGHGFVQGEGFGCGDNCKKTYEEGTVVHLKAIPFPDARFAGWKIDGKPHKGVLTITKDTVISAIFRLKAEAPSDELRLYWYGGFGGRDYATIALDEMIVLLEKREKWGVTTEEEYNTALQKVIQTFHPQAENTGVKPFSMLFLKSPEPLAKEQWFRTLFSLQELMYVQWAGPMLYKSPGDAWSQVIVWNEVSVYFPESYTEDRIKTIEQEYGLVRIEPLGAHNSFVYRAGSPLEAIELANRLYESGLVEHSIPVISENLAPQSDINDTYFKKQWHLNNTIAGYEGQDINVLPVWENGYTGSGIVIAIVDDGVEFTHEDLKDSRLPDKLNDPHNPLDDESYHYDYIEGDSDPIDNNISPLPEGVRQRIPKPSKCVSGCHGTAVAGVAAAQGNKVGIRGVAPSAWLVGYRINLCDPPEKPCIYSLPPRRYKGLYKGGKDMIIDVYNSSLGTGQTRSEGSLDQYKDMVTGAEKSNLIYVRSAGNMGDRIIEGVIQPDVKNANTNYYRFTNSRYTIAVGASGHNGEAHNYSTPGATVLVNAPSGIYTTDRSGDDGYSLDMLIRVDYNLINYLGTKCYVPSDFYLKAISPLIGQEFANINELLKAIEDEAVEEGIEAEQIAQYKTLILECIQEYLNNLPNGDYSTFAGTSAAAPVASGVVALMLQAKPELSWRDVQQILIESVQKNSAETWTPNAAGYSHSYTYGFGRVDAGKAVELAETWTPVPDETSSTAYRGLVGSMNPSMDGHWEGVSVNVPVIENLKVEFVETTFTSDHPRWGDLDITLTSPTGTESVLAEQIISEKLPYDHWRFGSRRHFGEYSQGDWFLTVRDRNPNGDIGTYFDWNVKVYGTELPTWEVTLPSNGTCCESGGEVVCTFDEGKNSLIFRPKEVNSPHVQHLFAEDCELFDMELHIPHKGYTGTYWFPKSGGDLEIAVDWKPKEEWFDFREPETDTLARRCPEAPDYDPDRDTPPETITDTQTVDWSITGRPVNGSCEVQMTWDKDDVEPLTIEVQPQRLCHAPIEQVGTFEVAATYSWAVVERVQYADPYYDCLEPVHETLDERMYDVYDPKHLKYHATCAFCDSFHNPTRKTFHPHENWPYAPSLPPLETFDPTPPKPGDSLIQVIAVESTCVWHEEPWSYRIYDEELGEHRYTSFVHLTDGTQAEQYYGWYVCEKTTTSIKWQILDLCVYQETLRKTTSPSAHVITLQP